MQIISRLLKTPLKCPYYPKKVCKGVLYVGELETDLQNHPRSRNVPVPAANSRCRQATLTQKHKICAIVQVHSRIKSNNVHMRNPNLPSNSPKWPLNRLFCRIILQKTGTSACHIHCSEMASRFHAHVKKYTLPKIRYLKVETTILEL